MYNIALVGGFITPPPTLYGKLLRINGFGMAVSPNVLNKVGFMATGVWTYHHL